MTANNRSIWQRRLSLAALVVYWAALFAATHTPPSQQVVVPASDKLLHATAFAVLSFLIALAWSLRSSAGWRQFFAMFCILIVYAALDEATQPLVERRAEWFDWAADVAGVLGGFAIFYGARAIWQRAAQPRAQ